MVRQEAGGRHQRSGLGGHWDRDGVLRAVDRLWAHETPWNLTLLLTPHLGKPKPGVEPPAGEWHSQGGRESQGPDLLRPLRLQGEGPEGTTSSPITNVAFWASSSWPEERGHRQDRKGGQSVRMIGVTTQHHSYRRSERSVPPSPLRQPLRGLTPPSCRLRSGTCTREPSMTSSPIS